AALVSITAIPDKKSCQAIKHNRINRGNKTTNSRVTEPFLCVRFHTRNPRNRPFNFIPPKKLMGEINATRSRSYKVTQLCYAKSILKKKNKWINQSPVS